MKFYSLSLRNFLSYKDALIYPYDTGLVQIDGVNGAGKSSLLAAIVWALYGVTPDGRKADEVIRTGADGCFVILKLELDDTSVEIIRGRGTSKQLTLLIDGEDNTATAEKETQQKILSLLGVDYQTFLSVVMMPQRVIGLGALSDTQIKQVFDEVLGLEKYQIAEDRAKKKAATLRQRQQVINNGISIIESRLQVYEKELNDSRNMSKWFYKDQLERKQLKEKQLKELLPIPVPTESQDLIRKRRVLQDLKANSQKHLDEYDTALNNYTRHVADLKALEFEIKTLNAALRAKEAAKRCGNSIEESCPTCGTQLPDDQLETLREAERQREAQEDFYLKQTEQKRDVLLKELDALSTHIQTLQILKDKAFKKLDTQTIDALQHEVDRDESNYKELQRLHENYIRERDQLVRSIDHIDNETNPYIQAEEKYINSIKDEKKRLVVEQTIKKELELELSLIEYWIQGFGNKGVKSLILSTALPYLNERANLYLSELTEGKASICIKSQSTLKSGQLRDKVDIEVNYGHGPQDFRSKSGGEKQRISIALMFALGDLAATRTRNISLRMLDEPFESVDAQGAEAMINLLRNHIAPKAGSVYVVTHNQELGQFFEDRLLVVNQGGTSVLQNQS